MLPALDLEPLDEDEDASVLPAFERAPLLGLAITTTSFLRQGYRRGLTHPLPPGHTAAINAVAERVLPPRLGAKQ